MSKLSDITKQKEELEKIKKELEEKAKSIDPQVIKKQYLDFYCDYFDRKNNADIELLKKIPRFSVFADNNGFFGKNHPLYEYGIYDIETLSILIKQLYSVHREGEYGIRVFGHCDEKMEYDYGSKWFVSTPELYFLIGKSELLKEYNSWNGLFIDEDMGRYIPSIHSPQKDLIVLKADEYSPYFDRKEETPIELTKFCTYKDKHASRNEYPHHSLSQRFSQSYRTIKNPSPQNYSHGNTRDYGLTFPISMKDTFIRDFIFSVSLYRKNNGLTRNLTNEELNLVFNKLYSTNANIVEERETAFVKKIKHVDKI